MRRHRRPTLGGLLREAWRMRGVMPLREGVPGAFVVWRLHRKMGVRYTATR